MTLRTFRRQRPPRSPADRGSAAVELVLLTPALMLAIFLLVQAALYMHARHVALAAAQQGARLARVSPAGADPAGVRTATLDYLRQLGADVISQPTVAVSRSLLDATATVDITANAVSIVPGLHLRVRARSTGPVETFHAP